jgi:hypothetical protein
MTTVWDLHNGATLRWQTFPVDGGAKGIIRDDRLGRRWTDTAQPASDVLDDDVIDEEPERARSTLPREVLDFQLDWRNSPRSYRPQPCVHCGQLTQLLDDSNRSSHKICAERALIPRKRSKHVWQADPALREDEEGVE